MSTQTSRLNRDVHPQTSGSDRDVSAKRHAQTVTFEREPLLSFCTPDPAAAAWLQLALALDALAEAGRPTPCQVDPEPFVSEERTERAEAAQACQGCAVIDLCERYATTAQEPFHVWGGLQPSQRRKRAREVTA